MRAKVDCDMLSFSDYDCVPSRQKPQGQAPTFEGFPQKSGQTDVWLHELMTARYQIFVSLRTPPLLFTLCPPVGSKPVNQ
jgi:hypothetical protein